MPMGVNEFFGGISFAPLYLKTGNVSRMGSRSIEV